MLALHGERLHGAVPLNPGAMTAPLGPRPLGLAGAAPPRGPCRRRPGRLRPGNRSRRRSRSAGRILGHERHPAREAHIRAWRVPPAGPPVLVYDRLGPEGRRAPERALRAPGRAARGRVPRDRGPLRRGRSAASAAPRHADARGHRPLGASPTPSRERAPRAVTPAPAAARPQAPRAARASRRRRARPGPATC